MKKLIIIGLMIGIMLITGCDSRFVDDCRQCDTDEFCKEVGNYAGGISFKCFTYGDWHDEIELEPCACCGEFCQGHNCDWDRRYQIDSINCKGSLNQSKE